MEKESFKDKKPVIYTAAVLMAVIWGLSFIVLQVALTELSVIQSMAMRWTMAACVCLVLICTKVLKVSYKGKPLKLLLFAVFLQPCLYAMLEALGVALTTSTESAVLIALVPVVVVLLSIVFLRQHIALLGIAGIVIAFSGVVVTAVFSKDFSLGGKWIGYLALSGAVLTGALFTLASKKISKDGHFSATEITVAMSFGGAIFYNLMSLFLGNGLAPYAITFTRLDVALAVLFLGAACSVLCYVLFNYIVHKLPAYQASALQVNCITITAVVAGVLVRGDDFGWYTTVGLALMLGGIMLLTRQEEKESIVASCSCLSAQKQ